MHLIERAYESAFEPKPFASLLPELAAAVDADAAHINVWVPELGGELASSHSMPEALIRAYRERFWRIDLWRLAHERKGIPVGRPFAGHAIVPFKDLLKSEMYDDGLRRYGLFDVCGGSIYKRGAASAAVGLQRARGRPFYGKRELDRLGAVLPHMARAFGIRVQMGDLARQRDALAELADGSSDGALLLDASSRLVHATAKARALLAASGGPLRLERGRLEARDPAADAWLKSWTGARDGSVTRFGPVATFSARNGTSGYRLEIVPTRMEHGLVSWAGTAFLLRVHAHGDDARDAAQRLAARHGLTRAEAQLLRELAAGRSLAQAADRLARSRNTARNQLQSIFAKTGAHRQAELVATVLGAPAPG